MRPTVFGAAEWCRDGLVRITEILGTENAWFEHFEAVAMAIMKWSEESEENWKYLLTAQKSEIAGDMLQSLARLYVMSGKERYLL